MGVDQSRSFIDYARRNTDESIEYRHQRARDFSSDRQFDLIYSIFVSFNYMRRDEILPLLRKIRELLKPEGRFVLDIGHMLNFIDNYEPYIVMHHRRENLLMTRFIRHVVMPHHANWRHEETILVREADGAVSMYENFFDQMVLTAPEVLSYLATMPRS